MYPIVVTGDSGGGRHVRCYCNLPSCVTTGYLCKSPKGGCYSELVQDVRWARHGCIDEDPNVDLTSKCMNSPGRLSGAWSSSLLLCCFSDLCNHVDNPLANFKINDSISGANNLSELAAGTGGAAGAGAGAESPGEFWFRAATIAVPIFGALILFFLVALAIRILRTDTLDASHKLSAAYIHHGSTQGPMEQPLMKKSPIIRTGAEGHLLTAPVHAPLLLSHANHTEPRYFISAKKQENAKINLAATASSDSPPREDTYIIMQHSPQAQVSHSHSHSHSSPVHKPTNTELINVNINMASQTDSDSEPCANTKLYEKQRLPPDEKLYNKEAIRYWGQTASNINHCPR